jgi:hypothetical protein
VVELNGDRSFVRHLASRATFNVHDMVFGPDGICLLSEACATDAKQLIACGAMIGYIYMAVYSGRQVLRINPLDSSPTLEVAVDGLPHDVTSLSFSKNHLVSTALLTFSALISM